MQVNDVAEWLECTICRATMADPRVLQCQHALCLRCIYSYVGRDKGAVTIKCPLNCPQKTVIEDGRDVRSLPKNHLISNLCDATRRRQFASKELNRCDFCDEGGAGSGDGETQDSSAAGGVELSYCERCFCVMCPLCAKVGYSDHTFLCSELAGPKTASPADASNANPLSSAAGGAVGSSTAAASGGDETAAASASEARATPGAAAAMRMFPFLYTVKEAGQFVKDRLREERQITDLQQFTLRQVFVPFFESRVVCKGTHGSAVVEAEYDIFTAGEQRLAEGQVQNANQKRALAAVEKLTSGVMPFVDDGFQCMQYVREVLDRSALAMSDVKGVAELVRRRLRFGATTGDLSTAAALCGVMHHVIALERLALRPTAQRIVICGNIEGCAVVERLHRAIGVGTGIVKVKLQRRIEMHQQISCRLNAALAELVAQLAKRSEAATTVVAEIERLIAERLAAPTDAARPARGSGPKPASTIGSDGPRLFEKLHAMTAALVENGREVCARAERQCAAQAASSTASPAQRRALIEAEESSTAATRVLMSSLGSAQHLSVLWAQMALEGGADFERRHVESMPRFHTLGTVDLPDVISQLNPQISAIREQHLQLMRRNPSDTMQHRSLNSQLSQLQEQTIDLFQKEHLIQLNNATEALGRELVANTQRLFSTYQHSAGGRSLSFGPETIEALLAAAPVGMDSSAQANAAAASRATERNGALAGLVETMGRHLNHHTKRMPNAARAQLNSQVPIAALLMAAGNDAREEGEDAGAGAGRGRPARLPQSPALTVKYRWSTDAADDDAEHIRGAFSEASKARVTELAKKALQDDDKTVSNITVVSTLRPGARMLPFYAGHFIVRGDPCVYHYCFYAQTGECTIDFPPLRGLAKLKDVAYNAAFTAPMFWTVNAVMFSAFVVVDAIERLRGRQLVGGGAQ